MANTINSISEAVDNKYVVVKSVSNQAQPGTLVHIMDGKESLGKISVKYRVTSTGQDFSINFNNMKEFFKWASFDPFIARYYENFGSKEILNYLKINDRTFTSFCLPFFAVALVVSIILGVLLGDFWWTGIILFVVAAGIIFFLYKSQKTKVKLKLYKKVSSNWAGGGIKF